MILIPLFFIFYGFAQAHMEDWRCIGPEPRIYAGCPAESAAAPARPGIVSGRPVPPPAVRPLVVVE